MSARAILSTIPYKIKENEEKAAFMDYTARCLRIITENTAKFGGGSYMKAEFSDIVKPQNIDHRNAEQIISDTVENIGIELR